MAKYFFTEPVPMQVILRDGRVYEERAYCPTDARLAVAAHGEAGWEDVMDAKVAISTEAMRAAVSGWSPVIITVRMPARWASVTESRTSVRGGSIMPTMPFQMRSVSMASA